MMTSEYDNRANGSDDYLGGDDLEGFEFVPVDEAEYARLRLLIAPLEVRLKRLDDTRDKLREICQCL